MRIAKRITVSPHRDLLFALLLLACGIVPFVFISVASGFPPMCRLYHEAFHAVMETLGCMMALGIAGFLLMRQGEKGNEHKLWPACAMLSMAILDAFHAGVAPGREFVGLHSVAQFVGGVLMASIWLPEQFTRTQMARQLPKLLAGACAFFGIVTVLFPEILPPMTSGERFTFAPQFLNLAGGVLFLAGLAYFARRFCLEGDNTHLLFIAYCLMFGVAGLTFRLSGLWGVGWWLSHVLRLGAYVVAFGYVSINTSAEYLRLARTEETLRRLAAIVESSDDAIIGETLDGTIESWNPGAESIYGYSAEEVRGQPGLLLVPADRLDEEVKILAKIKDGQRVDCFETVRRKRSGGLIDVSLRICPIEDLRGGTIGVSTIARDITERKQAEKELEELNERLEFAVEELTRANKELQDFAHIAAHDLKTPLRAITTLAEWISVDYAEKLDDQGKEHVRLLVTKAKQMAALIDDILRYCRLGRETAGKSGNSARLDLNAIVSAVVTEIAPPENIRVSVESGLPTVTCPKTHIIQIFQNLVGNAVKYMDKPDGWITVGCVEQDAFWRFSIADNGPGIERRYFEKIFEMFQTLAPREGVESNGIGLSIVKKLVELNGGRVWVESTPGQGSTFFFTLPKQMDVVRTPPPKGSSPAD